MKEKSEKKKRKNGKAKGNSFERLVSKQLSLFLTQGKDEMAIWRSASSGAMATQNFKRNKTSIGNKIQVGDLVQITPKGIYSELDNFFETYFIEVKSLSSLDLSPNYSKQFQTIFSQLLREKEQSGKKIFFVLKRNGRKVLIITDTMITDCNCISKFIYEGIIFDIYYFDEFVGIEN